MTEAEIDEAISRLALTNDGMALYRRLVRTLLGNVPPDAADSTLRELGGRRRFAAELKALMDRTLAKATPRSDRSDPDAIDLAPSEPGQPASIAGGSGSRRRVGGYPDET